MDYFNRINTELNKVAFPNSLIPNDKDVLSRTRQIMEFLGNPQNKLKIIHIAGTSGKTSTAYYMSALLTQTGCTVGLTVSPYVDAITERLQVNNIPLDPKDFYDLLVKFLELVNSTSVKLSYFELLYCFSFWVFAGKGVDYAVVETGMGGLYDATNIADRPDKVCLITDIGLDHTSRLGNRIEEIAKHKAGIIHHLNPVFTFNQPEPALSVIKEQCLRRDSKLTIVNSYTSHDQLSGLPSFQSRNWTLAHEAYLYICERDNLRVINNTRLIKTKLTYIPCRMEIVNYGDKEIIMDGAHNGQKIKALVNSYTAIYPNTKAIFLLALKAGKNIKEISSAIKPVATTVIVTTFKSNENLPSKAVEPSEIVKALQNIGITSVAITDQDRALNYAISGEDKVLIICGSFYLLSQLRSTHSWLKQKS